MLLQLTTRSFSWLLLVLLLLLLRCSLLLPEQGCSVFPEAVFKGASHPGP